MSLVQKISVGDPATLTLSVNGDNAVSNGISVITISCQVLDSNDEGVSDLAVVFQLKDDSNSVFKDSSSIFFKTTTGNNGSVDAHVINASGEKVSDVVNAFVLDNQDLNDSVSINFKAVTEELDIESVYTAQKTLLTGQPTIAWAGSQFFIKTSGGSGTLDWIIVTDSVSPFISLQSDENILTVNILTAFLGSVELLGTDKGTGETVSYSFSLSDFIVFVSEEMTYADLLARGTTDRLPSLSNFQSLYNQWGDLSLYDEWPETGEYWSSNHEETTASAFNIQTGTSRDASISSTLFVAVNLTI